MTITIDRPSTSTPTTSAPSTPAVPMPARASALRPPTEPDSRATANPPAPVERWPAVAAAGLTAGFAVVHIAWATGWRWGVPVSTAPIADRPVFLAYVIAATLVMAIASLLAVRLAGSAAGTDRVSVWSRRLAVAGGAVAALRGVGGLIVDAVATVLQQPPSAVSVVADIWFMAIGAAFVFAVLPRRRADDRSDGREFLL